MCLHLHKFTYNWTFCVELHEPCQKTHQNAQFSSPQTSPHWGGDTPSWLAVVPQLVAVHLAGLSTSVESDDVTVIEDKSLTSFPRGRKDRGWRPIALTQTKKIFLDEVVQREMGSRRP